MGTIENHDGSHPGNMSGRWLTSRFHASSDKRPARRRARSAMRRSPWQNGIAERWVGSCRRELLDHVIPLNEQHLRRLVRDYVVYYQEDRIHDALGQDTPNLRPVEKKPVCGGEKKYQRA